MAENVESIIYDSSIVQNVEDTTGPTRVPYQNSGYNLESNPTPLDNYYEMVRNFGDMEYESEFYDITNNLNLNITTYHLRIIKRLLNKIITKYKKIKERYDNLVDKVSPPEKLMLNSKFNEAKQIARQIIRKSLNVIDSKRKLNIANIKKNQNIIEKIFNLIRVIEINIENKRTTLKRKIDSVAKYLESIIPDFNRDLNEEETITSSVINEPENENGEGPNNVNGEGPNNVNGEGPNNVNGEGPTITM